MCIAVPGTLTALDGHKGRVNVRGNLLNVEMGAVKAKVGDAVLVHAGCAISVLREKEREEMDELFALLDEMRYEKD